MSAHPPTRILPKQQQLATLAMLNMATRLPSIASPCRRARSIAMPPSTETTASDALAMRTRGSHSSVIGILSRSSGLFDRSAASLNDSRS